MLLKVLKNTNSRDAQKSNKENRASVNTVEMEDQREEIKLLQERKTDI